MKIDTVACWTGVVGAALIASRTNWNDLGYSLCLTSSLSWICWGDKHKNWNIVIMNIIFSLINVLGIYRYLP